MSENTKGLILLVIMFLFLLVIVVYAFISVKNKRTYQWTEKDYIKHIEEAYERNE